MTSEEQNGDDQTGNDPDRLEKARRDKMQKIVDLGFDPWGGRFDGHVPIAKIRDQISEAKFKQEDGTLVDLIDPETQPEGFQFREWLGELGKGEMVRPKVRAAGRIVLQRDKGKLRFVDIRDMSGQIQLFIGKGQVGDENFELAKCFDLGDIVAVDGELGRTKTGELTIFAEKVHFLTKSLEPPPEKHHGLADPELRQRMRYLDLTYGDGVMERFLNRTRIVKSVRETLNNLDFCEIEGPTLHTIAGGAAARPFETHHNTLDMDLVLRIALELHLKRLMVGGIERVYEIGRVYRNEGISPKHNPEFTMLEVYQAYGNYETMMDLTEKIFIDAIAAIGKGNVLPWGDTEIDFSPPFARCKYDDLVKEHAGIDPHDTDAIIAKAKELHLDTDGRHPDVIKNEVFEATVEEKLVNPTFVIDYPASICPLTKRKADNPAIAERFELFVHGMEVANAYTELNDPDLQEELFRTQLEGLSDEDSMAKMDNDFIRALRHGMPPAGGLGIGIDRMVMLLTNTTTIRDIILFPLLRPEQ